MKTPGTHRPSDPIHYIGLGFFLVAGFVVALAVTAALRWNVTTSTVRTVVRALPVSVATATSRMVSYRSWDDLAAAQQTYLDRLARTQGGTAVTPLEVRRAALDSAIRLTVTKSLAAQYHISVTSAEVQQQLQRSIDLSADPATLERIVNEYYGWDVPTLVRVVIEPYLLRSKIDDAIAADTALGEDPRTKAQRVLTELQKPDANVEAIAQRESEDAATRSSGGATLISKATFTDPQVRDTVFALKAGELSGVLTVGNAFMIVRVDNILKNESDSEPVLQAHTVVVRIRNVDTVVSDRLQQTPPHIFLAPFSWDRTQGCVAAPGIGCGTT